MSVKITTPFPSYKNTTLYVYEYDMRYDHWTECEVVSQVDGRFVRQFLDFSKYQTMTEQLYKMMVDLGLPDRYTIPSNGTLYPEDVEIAWTKWKNGEPYAISKLEYKS